MVDEQESVDKEFALKFQVWEWAFKTIWMLIRACLWVVLAYILHLSVKDLAGKATFAQFIIEGLQSRVGKIEILACILLVVWALTERQLRRRKVRYLARRLQECEQRIDPERTSSDIHETGKTHPRDKLP